MRAKLIAALITFCVTLSRLAPIRADLPPAPGGGPVARPVEAKKAFVPRAGYASTADYLFRERRNAEVDPRPPAAGMIAPGAPPPPATWGTGPSLVLKGSRSIPVILFEYDDVAHPFEPEAYRELLFSKQRPSLSLYYHNNSFGLLQVTGRVVGWYKLPKKAGEYEAGGNTGKIFGDLLEELLRRADGEIDFGEFDNDGPDGKANSEDDDGVVDTVILIHPRAGRECGGNVDSSLRSGLPSHSWHYDEPVYGHSSPFVTKAISRSKKVSPASDGSPARIVVKDYTLQPGLSCKSTPGANVIVEIGVFCHEFGHALGLPDLYDRNYQTYGVGNYCLMSYGMYGADGKDSSMPAAMCAWCKYYLGWAAVEDPWPNKLFFIDAVQDRNRIYRAIVPKTGRKEYFLFEYRPTNWTDSIGSRVNWDQRMPASGLAIWHVDERVGSSSPIWPFAEVGKGQNDNPSMPGHVPPPSFISPHSLVSLIQQDGRLDLEKHAKELFQNKFSILV